ncbi:hypothetical protein EOD39_15976 [Acipenser ruthenus]|uniref:Uncharacterized protein n=1 Tax=Acipenser ruthenus TaxID=7906 RepID=A0A444V6W8_ACIRT|nr:hypothetical protein EOD39_15976 [Acipenser ruthenus]
MISVLKGSVILMSDLVFAPPAPTPKAVLDSLLDSIDSNESLGGSALHVDRYSVIAGAVRYWSGKGYNRVYGLIPGLPVLAGSLANPFIPAGQEDLEVEGAVFLNTRTHVNSQDILRLLYRLANQSVDLTSLNVNGIGQDE